MSYNPKTVATLRNHVIYYKSPLIGPQMKNHLAPLYEMPPYVAISVINIHKDAIQEYRYMRTNKLIHKHTKTFRHTSRHHRKHLFREVY